MSSVGIIPAVPTGAYTVFAGHDGDDGDDGFETLLWLPVVGWSTVDGSPRVVGLRGLVPVEDVLRSLALADQHGLRWFVVGNADVTDGQP